MESYKLEKFTIVDGPPPLWRLIKLSFPDASLDKQIFAFGRKIYWKHQNDGQPLQDDIIAHEAQHLEQQGFSFIGACAWWRKFAKDPQFRADMEIDACRAQLKKAKQMTNNHQKIFELAHTMAKNLSSEVYNHCITEQEAYKRITQL